MWNLRVKSLYDTLFLKSHYIYISHNSFPQNVKYPKDQVAVFNPETEDWILRQTSVSMRGYCAIMELFTIILPYDARLILSFCPCRVRFLAKDDQLLRLQDLMEYSILVALTLKSMWKFTTKDNNNKIIQFCKKLKVCTNIPKCQDSLPIVSQASYPDRSTLNLKIQKWIFHRKNVCTF